MLRTPSVAQYGRHPDGWLPSLFRSGTSKLGALAPSLSLPVVRVRPLPFEIYCEIVYHLRAWFLVTPLISWCTRNPGQGSNAGTTAVVLLDV